MQRAAAHVALLLAVALPLDAQRVTLHGRILDSLTVAPVAGARVFLLEQGVETSTDVDGRFTLKTEGGGRFTVLVQSVGYQPGALEFDLSVSRDVEVDLGAIVIERLPYVLDTLVLAGDEVNERLRDVGFLHRMRTEVGTFITLEDIQARNPALTSELFKRVPGFRVMTDGAIASRRGIPSVQRGFSLCGVQYYIDGVHASPPDVDVVIPTSISGIEIYTGSATIPPAFRSSSNPKCGVVAIWTRDGRGARKPR
ncbi:MAG: carboxypeptidase-like regulatory domain-containing protein [Gemmatimonadales bacterium]